MKSDSLLVGDIIIFRRRYYPFGYKVVGGSVTNAEGELETTPNYDTSYDDHVAMYAGRDSETHQHTILHSIDDGDPYGVKSGLGRTAFRPMNAQVETDEDGCQFVYDVEYHVYRCKDRELAMYAYQLLSLQSSRSVPYDNQRLDEMLSQENILRSQNQSLGSYLETSRREYLQAGRYRAIKFAMRPEQWVRTRADGIGTGLICYTVVILAYQIAELLYKDLLQVSLDDELAWVSDKYGVPQENHSYSEGFLQYHRTLTASISDRSKISTRYKVSPDFWKGSEQHPSIEDFISKLPLDSKKCSVSAMAAYFEEQKNLVQPENACWESVGVVIAPEFKPSAEEKERHRRDLRLRRVSSLQELITRAENNPSTVSPSGSSSPSRATANGNSPILDFSFFAVQTRHEDESEQTPRIQSKFVASDPVERVREIGNQITRVSGELGQLPWATAQLETVLAALLAIKTSAADSATTGAAVKFQ